MQRDNLQFHNVAELYDADEHDGSRLHRVPEHVRTELNEGAQNRMCHPAGAELRFVPDGPVQIQLSATVRESTVRFFWGDFQATGQSTSVGPEPTTIEVQPHDNMAELPNSVTDSCRYHPRVCRLVLPGEHRSGHVYYHSVDGDVRPPEPAETPSHRYLAYGTSITEGEGPVSETLTYVNQTARRLDSDPVNLGSCGTAYCDQAIAKHIANRDDWDIATLSLSLNMVGTFSVATFRERAATMVDAIASANPNNSIACITLLPNAHDFRDDHPESRVCEQFRETLRSVVADCTHENVHLIEGSDLLPTPSGLTTDLVHPGDDAMIRIGEHLANALRPLSATGAE